MSFKIFPDIVKEMGSLTDKEQQRVIFLFKEIRPTYSLQKEILEYILDIKGRDRVPVEKIIDEKIEEILYSSIPREKKLDKIRNYLRQIRFPLLTKAEEIFKNRVGGLNLPSGCEVIPPLYWEDSEYKLKLNFKNNAEFSKKLDKILEVSKTQAWQELISEKWFETLFSSKSIDR